MFINVSTLSLSTEIISVGKKVHVPNACFSILWRFEVCEPRQLLMLLLSLFQSFFLLSNPLTEHCTHCVCVCARTTANYKPNEMITMYSMRHFCNTSFKFLIVLIAPELKLASIFNAILAR